MPQADYDFPLFHLDHRHVLPSAHPGAICARWRGWWQLKDQRWWWFESMSRRLSAVSLWRCDAKVMRNANDVRVASAYGVTTSSRL